MKVVYFGTDLFIDVFRYFCSKHNIIACYTYHNDEDYFADYAIVREAAERGIPIHYEAVTESDIKRYISEDGCEMFFSAEYDKVIPIPDDIVFRGINTHASLLPEGRSYYPVENAFRKGLKKTGVTVHIMESEIDRGNILSQRSVDILDSDDSVDIYIKMGRCAAEMVCGLFENNKSIDEIWEKAEKQMGVLPYWRRPFESEMLISHNMTVCVAENIFRCYNKMSKVNIGGTLYYISFLTAGKALLINDVQWLSENRVLYKLKDGHIRLELHKVR